MQIAASFQQGANTHRSTTRKASDHIRSDQIQPQITHLKNQFFDPLSVTDLLCFAFHQQAAFGSGQGRSGQVSSGQHITSPTETAKKRVPLSSVSTCPPQTQQEVFKVKEVQAFRLLVTSWPGLVIILFDPFRPIIPHACRTFCAYSCLLGVQRPVAPARPTPGLLPLRSAAHPGTCPPFSPAHPGLILSGAALVVLPRSQLSSSCLASDSSRKSGRGQKEIPITRPVSPRVLLHPRLRQEASTTRWPLCPPLPLPPSLSTCSRRSHRPRVVVGLLTSTRWPL